MIIEFDHKKWLKKTHIELDTKSLPIAVTDRRNNPAVRYLMRLAISSGCSVITYGSFCDYYKYISDIAPNSLSVIAYRELMEDAKAPFIRQSNEKSKQAVKNCFCDYCLESRFEFMSERINGQQYYDPNKNQSFFQIQTGDIAKQKVITEAFLVNIIAQGLYSEPLHEVIIFLDMPFRPITTTALDYLGMIRDTSNISLISMYQEDKDIQSPYIFGSDSQNLALKALNKEYLIPYE